MSGNPRTSVGKGIELVWPTELALPARPPSLVYLDINHWINLTKAKLGRGSDEYSKLLKECRSARTRGAARFVLTSSFVEEFSAIGNPKKRDQIVDLIDGLTDFEYLAGLVDIMKLELQAFLDVKTGTHGMGWGSVHLVGSSMLHSFGRIGGLSIRDSKTGVDVTEQARLHGGADFESRFARMNREAERQLLAGPRDEELGPLRAQGYQPERSRQNHHNNVLIEQEFADERLNEHWRKGRLLDVVAARHLNLELIDMLTHELLARELTFLEVAETFTQRLQLPLAMPSSAVFVGMKAHYHQDANHKWTDNDLHDIAALAVAVPYCDIVFTDAAARNALLASKLDQHLNTQIPRTPADLSAILREL